MTIFNKDNKVASPSPRGHVYMLEYLMGMRQNVVRSLLLSIGAVDVFQLRAFTNGYRSCQSVNGITDEEHIRFSEWLRDVKNEFPGEGWDVKYLRDRDGDHERAIGKYLDFVAEFVALRKHERHHGR